ncbi:T9SS type A sorting domain-containing protein [Lewinella sp. IMCC34183]|uniref:T9SS type A sorting domain-containing protein n=1 Tax=Lewinella sp. IMCC34183 TaxID=2248762 RepID=UPI000E225067|nr:T9SS type A sorting domain-containing protein [Lewinella sp. IMCC34183]
MLRLLPIGSILLLPVLIFAQPCDTYRNLSGAINSLSTTETRTVGAEETFCVRINANGPQEGFTITGIEGEGALATLDVYAAALPDAPPVTVDIDANTFQSIIPIPGEYSLEVTYGAIGSFRITYDNNLRNQNNNPKNIVFLVEAALPVNWVRELAYRPAGERLEFDWSVSDQVDVAGYELQAFDGDGFKTVEKIAYRDNGSLETGYSVRTNWPQAATYYRVRQLDFDGTADYSNIVFVPGEERTSEEVMVFPNPATNKVRMTVPEGIGSVDLIDAAGRLLQTYNADIARGGIDVSTVPEGMYFIRTQGANVAGTTQRLVIRH